MGSRKGIGGHQATEGDTNVWLTPKWILDALGPFDLDPCAADPRPWDTATHSFTVRDNGLIQPWEGRVWLNPPYGPYTRDWMRRLCEHGQGTALIFARTETAIFFPCIWEKATALLFIRGRLYFHHPDGTRAEANSGAPSVLVAYGDKDADRLADSGIPGALVSHPRMIGDALMDSVLDLF